MGAGSQGIIFLGGTGASRVNPSFRCVFFPSFVAHTRLEVNCSFHCWQGPSDLPPQWVLQTLDRLQRSGLCVYRVFQSKGCWTEISNQFQFSAVSLPVRWHTHIQTLKKKKKKKDLGPEVPSWDGLWSQVSLVLVCIPCPSHCWLSSLLVCLNKHWLGLG